MKTNEYFYNLSKTYSGNYMAMLGFVIFLFSFLGIISRLTQGIIFRNSSIIKSIPICFLGETYCYLSITCLLAIIPVIVLFKNLIKPKHSLKKQIVNILVSVFLCVGINIFAIDYTYMDATIFFVFIPNVMGYYIPMIVLLIFLILLWIDFAKNPNINNKLLINNKFYQIIINIFFCYSTIITITTPLIIHTKF